MMSSGRNSSLFMREEGVEQLESNGQPDSQPREPFIDGCECEIISINKHQNATLSVNERSIIIMKDDERPKVIKLAHIKSILVKCWHMFSTAVEIVSSGGQSYLINMKSVPPKTLLDYLPKQSLPELQYGLMKVGYEEYFAAQGFTKRWVNNEISTFEYLTHLNNFSGRSFNSVLLYPIFPWILSDYGANLDFSKESSFRRLYEPMGAIDKGRLKELMERAKSRSSKFLYDSTYSTPTAVLRFLSKIEPFASMAESSMVSITDEFKLASGATGTLGEYSELTPEFFFLPEAFTDVSLPPWASNPYEFVYVHRKLLESDIVSAHIHRWIGLIWGTAQRGEDAVSSKNTFAPELYPGTPDSDTTGMRGQIPVQLFTNTIHPARIKKQRVKGMREVRMSEHAITV